MSPEWISWAGALGSPNWVVARFSGRADFDTLVFAANAAGARKLSVYDRNLSEPGPVDSDGNLVHIRIGHGIPAVQKVISACEKNAKET
jgi:hypothetical protein